MTKTGILRLHLSFLPWRRLRRKRWASLIFITKIFTFSMRMASLTSFKPPMHLWKTTTRPSVLRKDFLSPYKGSRLETSRLSDEASGKSFLTFAPFLFGDSAFRKHHSYNRALFHYYSRFFSLQQKRKIRKIGGERRDVEWPFVSQNRPPFMTTDSASSSKYMLI